MITNVNSKLGRRFDIFIQILIVLSMIAFAVETIPNLHPNTVLFLKIFDVFCVVVFTIEYIFRVYYAASKLKYIFSFYGLIDLLAILPFYIAIGVDLRSLRAFRVFRIFRVLKLVRYNKALNRFKTAAVEAKEEVILFLFITAILIYLSAVGIYYFEHDVQPEKFKSIFHSLWWSISTLTTVGYGDVYPVTTGGKLFTFCILIVGLGIVTVPAGIVAAALSKATKASKE